MLHANVFVAQYQHHLALNHHRNQRHDLHHIFFSHPRRPALWAQLHHQHQQPQIKPQIYSYSDPHPILIRKALSASRVHLLLGSSITHTLWWLTQSLSSRLPFLPFSSSNFQLPTNFFFGGCALFWFDRLVLAGSVPWKRWKWLVLCSTKDLRVKVDSKKRNKRP